MRINFYIINWTDKEIDFTLFRFNRYKSKYLFEVKIEFCNLGVMFSKTPTLKDIRKYYENRCSR